MALPIRRFVFSPDSKGRDLHVVPGMTTRDLRDNLFVVFADRSFDGVKNFVTTAGATSFRRSSRARWQGPPSAASRWRSQLSVDVTTGK